MKIVIVGGIAAGMSAAAKARRVNPTAEIIVYEKGPRVSFGACGLPYYLAGYFDDPNQMIARDLASFQKQNITIKLRHEVLAVNAADKKITVKDLTSGNVLLDNYDKLMIATGAHVVMPAIKNSKKENIFTLRTMEDGIRLREYIERPDVQHVTVVGAGFVGVELCDALLHQKKTVRMIQLANRVMGESFDAEFCELIEAKLIDNGVFLHTSETVKELIGDETITEVVTDKGKYPTDAIIFAIGIRPNTKFLGEEFEKFKNGALLVDQYGQTSVPDVYAAGDCATVRDRLTGYDIYLPLATTANKFGRIVGENLAGNKKKFAGMLGTSGIKLLDLEAASTGLTETRAKELDANYRTVLIDDKNQTNYYPGQKPIRVKLIYNANSYELYGGQIAGENGAALRIDVLALAVATEFQTEDLGFLDLLYAPPYARTWDALNVAGNVAK
jgi:NADPH-dependent 2,4-dienoyl-CoA reductase/sulfur reductase-like enzyme